jgi:hypothetical protein
MHMKKNQRPRTAYRSSLLRTEYFAAFLEGRAVARLRSDGLISIATRRKASGRVSREKEREASPARV